MIDAQLLDRYFTGACTAEEASYVRTVIAANTHLAALQRDVRGEEVDVPAAWAEFGRRVLAFENDLHERAPFHHKRRAGWLPTRRSRGGWLGLASLTLGVAGMVLLMSRGVSPKSLSWTVYTTPHAQVRTLTLNDGSRVTLAPRTTLRVAVDGATHGRIAELSGEALFTIVDAPRTPFIVRSGRSVTRVLGTVFDVKHYPADHGVRIAVLAGKVVVARTSESPHVSSARLSGATISAGTAVRIPDDSAATQVAIHDTSDYTAWTRGQLVFRRTPLDAVLAAVGQWYGMRFRLADSSLAAARVTATLDGASRAETLRALQSLLDVTMTFDASANDTLVTLVPRSHHPATVPVRGPVQDVLPLTPHEVGR